MQDKGMARDSRLMAAFVQTLVGLFCFFVGLVISFASVSAAASKLEQGRISIEAAILEDEPDDVVRTIRCPNFDCKYGIEIETGKKGNKRQKIRCPECSRKIALPMW